MSPGNLLWGETWARLLGVWEIEQFTNLYDIHNGGIHFFKRTKKWTDWRSRDFYLCPGLLSLVLGVGTLWISLVELLSPFLQQSHLLSFLFILTLTIFSNYVAGNVPAWQSSPMECMFSDHWGLVFFIVCSQMKTVLTEKAVNERI